jgi:hypothetical protein
LKGVSRVKRVFRLTLSNATSDVTSLQWLNFLKKWIDVDTPFFNDNPTFEKFLSTLEESLQKVLRLTMQVIALVDAFVVCCYFLLCCHLFVLFCADLQSDDNNDDDEDLPEPPPIDLLTKPLDQASILDGENSPLLQYSALEIARQLTLIGMLLDAGDLALRFHFRCFLVVLVSLPLLSDSFSFTSFTSCWF